MAVLLGVAVVGLVVAGPSALEMMPSFGAGDDALEVRGAKVERR
jgi:hypothetical protein